MATTMLKIGSSMPEFDLPATDGKNYSNAYFVDYKGLIIIFSCNHCPYVQAYEERMKAVAADYSSKGIAMAAVNPNDVSKYEDDSFEGMIKRAAERKFNFPYLRDESQETAKAFGATHTPEVFLFDDNRKLIYHGKIDDNWQEPDAVQNSYLRTALDEYLKNEDISVPETYSIGCTIKWKD